MEPWFVQRWGRDHKKVVIDQGRPDIFVHVQWNLRYVNPLAYSREDPTQVCMAMGGQIVFSQHSIALETKDVGLNYLRNKGGL